MKSRVSPETFGVYRRSCRRFDGKVVGWLVHTKKHFQNYISCAAFDIAILWLVLDLGREVGQYVWSTEGWCEAAIGC